MIPVFFIVMTGCNKKEDKITGYQKLEYKEIYGETLYVEDVFKDKKIVLVANCELWDPVSIEQVQVLNSLTQKFDPDEMGLLAIFHESASRRHNVWELKSRGQYDFPFILADEKAGKIFRKKSIVPTILIMDSNGVVNREIIGFIDGESLENILKKHLKVVEF